MNILIISSNGREHALATAYSKSKKVKNVFIAPGNGLTDFQNKITNVPLPMTDIDTLIKFAKKENIDLVDISQDDCIAQGYVERFMREGITAFGPTQRASELEWSKDWARGFMQKYKLPIPHFRGFTNHKKAISYIKSLPQQTLFIKASGLALGKGVIRADTTKDALVAVSAMKQFGKAGETFLIEEGLVGEEFSLFTFCDGTNYKIIGAAQDHKTVYNGDKGPNTGGVGCVTPPMVITKKILKDIEQEIIQPVLTGMMQEKRPYTGILYLGGMLTKNGVKIVEFNARWGDPEAEVIIPSIQTDYLSITQAILAGELSKLTLTTDDNIRICVTGCARGYPIDYGNVKDKEIYGLREAMAMPGITVYGAGIRRTGKRFFVNGGRIFHIVAEGQTIQDAREKAYAAMSTIFIEGNNLHYRTDIGWRDIERTYTKNYKK